jgi:beta-galactosidase
LRSVVPFNDHWLFCPKDVPATTSDDDFVAITLPHTNKIFPHNFVDNLDYQFISTYRKRFKLPEPLNGRRLYIDFEGAMIASEVSVNGRVVGDYEGGFTPFSFDITDYLKQRGENLLSVRLDSTERPDIPPFGKVVDYLTFGGIYRDVSLRYVNPIHVSDVVVRTANVLDSKRRMEVGITVKNQNPSPGNIHVIAQLVTLDGEILDRDEDYLAVEGGAEGTLTLRGLVKLERIALWTLENPALYKVRVTLQIGTQTLDVHEVRFGFREAEFRKDGGFFLNGEPLQLRGLNRHQLYPYIGAAAPARLQRRDAEMLKYELGCNIARTSHYPQSKHFLNRCDEIGLLVFEEIPGWQHIGDADWQGVFFRDIEAMIMRDRNHPSIMLWGVRINESLDNEALYQAANDLAHKLDPTRQTGGVRYFITSQFLEDVFTYNDFSNGVIDPVHTPHLITEFSGHMFPTTVWDDENRQVDHALRHTRVQDLATANPRVSGAIGWCMFDYNTHVEFGGGDRICYHGVMDMYRLPKYAAHFYESQIDPAVRPVLHAATSYGFGDRSNYGADNPYDFYVFSNCEEIEVFIGDESIGRFQPDRKAFPNLPHPPFKVGDGQLWQRKFVEVGAIPDAHVVGYRGGQVVAETRLTSNKVIRSLVLKADDAELVADNADMTRVAFMLVDKYGHRLPQGHAIVTFKISGPGELIGENPYPLVGGQAAVYVRATDQAGTVTVKAQIAGLPEAKVKIKIVERA